MSLPFNSFVDRIFAPGVVPPSKSPVPNPVTGKLGNPQTNAPFLSNLEARLRRLNYSYGNSTTLDRTLFLQRVKNLNERTWDGAFAELCASDFFSRSERGWPPPALNQDVA